MNPANEKPVEVKPLGAPLPRATKAVSGDRPASTDGRIRVDAQGRLYTAIPTPPTK